MAILLLLPFVAWDIGVYLLRRRGDLSAHRRQDLLRHFTEAEIATGRDQVRRRLALHPVSRLIFYAGFGVLLFGGLAARLEARVLELSGHWALALPLFLLAILFGWSLLRLPLAVISEFVIERRAGLSTTAPGTFAADQLKGLVVGWVLTVLFALPIMALLRALPDWWPLPAAAAVVGVSAFAAWLSPWVIAPLFNTFTPLDDADLVERVRGLAQEAGLDLGGGVLVTDASRRTTVANAYFTGLGNSRRVVLFDTLVREFPPEEILSTVAHELGHWKRRHIAKFFLVQSAGTVVGLLLFQALLQSSLLAALGVPRPDSMAVLVLVVFMGSLSGVVTTPALTALSRRFERQADAEALRLTRDPEAFARLEVRLVRRAKMDLLQHRLLHTLYGTHPLPEERIGFAEAASRAVSHASTAPEEAEL